MISYSTAIGVLSAKEPDSGKSLDHIFYACSELVHLCRLLLFLNTTDIKVTAFGSTAGETNPETRTGRSPLKQMLNHGIRNGMMTAMHFIYTCPD